MSRRTDEQQFDEVGLEYARNFEAVEYARERFVQQRETILSDLCAVTVEAEEPKPMQPLDGPVKDVGEFRTFYWSRKLHAARTERRGKTFARRDGFWFGFRPEDRPEDGRCLAFVAELFFKMKRPGFDRVSKALKADIASLGDPARIRISYAKDHLWVSTSVVAVGDETFGWDALADAVRELPQQFVKADDCLATAYRAAWNMAG